jgi:hypothetical protein
MKDSKFICKHAEKIGTIVTRPASSEKSIKTSYNYRCAIKNISLNNIVCGMCNSFSNVSDPDIIFSERAEMKTPEVLTTSL